jgi:hypothetical protein
MQQPRKQVEAIERELVELEGRRRALRKLLKAYQQLQGLVGEEQHHQRTHSRNNEPRGTTSLRSAVLKVIEDSDEPLSAKEIWARVEEMGAQTSAKHPVAVVDLTAYQLRKSGKPIEKSEKRWRKVTNPAPT